MATIRIIVTNEVTGRTRMYSEFRRKGRWKLVPTYKMIVRHEKKSIEFAVTRDTATQIFGIGNYLECPASVHRKPFHAWVREDNQRGFRLQLCESLEKDPNTLIGRGSKTRSLLQIHRGPSKSHGCLSVAGGDKTYKAFEETLKKFLRKTRKIRVTVQQR